MKKKRVCKNPKCNKEITGYGRTGYCQKCAGKNKRKPKKIYHCIEKDCNNIVSRKGNRCFLCSIKKRTKKVKVKCSYCSKEIEVYLFKIKKCKYLFCNNKCYSKWQSKNRCGKNSYRYKERVKKGCGECGAILSLYPNQVRKNNFCDAKCLGKWVSKNCKGENNHNWQGGVTSLRSMIRSLPEYKDWRTKVYKRDNYTCQDCGDNSGGNLEAHHIKPFAKILQEFLQEYNQFSPMEDKETLVRLAMTYKPFWDINNGQTLCINCHAKTKKNGKKVLLVEKNKSFNSIKESAIFIKGNVSKISEVCKGIRESYKGYTFKFI